MIARASRILGTVLIAAGTAAIAWVFTVWVWKDPVTTLYTDWQQHRLAGAYELRVDAWRPRIRPVSSIADVRKEIAVDARRYRRESRRGQAIGRIVVPRLDLYMVLVDGTDEGSLEKGPGRDLRSRMPGEGELVYVAGHRTTYAAPFSAIDTLRRGDPVTIDLPYATFRYRITRRVVVPATDLSVLRSRGKEQLALQACHPRFFATHRYIAYARPVWVRMRGRGRQYRLWG